MKLLPILIVNLVTVGAGIFVYDQMREPDSGDVTYNESTTQYVEERGTSGPSLSGATVSQADFHALEAQVASLTEALARRHAARAGSSEGGTDGAAAASIDLSPVEGADPETGEGGTFDEKTLKTLQAYMAEIRDREQERRRREGVERRLDRLGLDLSKEQTDGIVDASLAYQSKRRETFRNTPRGDVSTEEGRARWAEEVRKATDTLKENFSTTVYSLVPAAEAEKVVEALSNGGARRRGMGLGGDRGGRRGR